MLFAGELAALTTGLTFAFGSTMFTIAGRDVGSPLVTRIRLLFAVVWVVLLHWLTQGQLLPLGASGDAVMWLSLSGVVGLVLGDALLFQSFVMVGPRLAMLMMSLAPILSAIMAYFALGQQLDTLDLAGMVITIVGVIWVVIERPEPRKRHSIDDTTADSRTSATTDATGEPAISIEALSRPIATPARSTSVITTTPREYIIGLLFGFGGAMGQAGGYILSKLGLADDFPAISGNVIRIIAATLVMWLFTLLAGQAVRSFQRMRHQNRALILITIASLTGPVIGVWLSLFSLQLIPVGVSSTLTALTPVFLLPISAIVFNDRITRQAVAGTLIAFAGTALLFLV